MELSSPFRFSFLAIGSPQQEMIAAKLKERGVVRGLALCIGAAVNYLTGIEKRVPNWMQQLGWEWFYRLVQNPRRLARRYLVRGPLIFPLLFQLELRLRRPPASGDKEVPVTARTTPLASSPGQAIVNCRFR
jgi:hypothetical protein